MIPLSLASIEVYLLWKWQELSLKKKVPNAGADPGFFQRGARKNAENQGHSSIELEMYKQYIAVLRFARNSAIYSLYISSSILM